MKPWILAVVLQTSSFLTEVFAQGTGNPPGDGGVPLIDPLGGKEFIDVVNKVADGLLQISIPIVAIMVIIGGFQIMSAGGDEEKYKTGRKTILYAVIGFAIVLVAKSIAIIIQNLLTK